MNKFAALKATLYLIFIFALIGVGVVFSEQVVYAGMIAFSVLAIVSVWMILYTHFRPLHV